GRGGPWKRRAASWVAARGLAPCSHPWGGSTEGGRAATPWGGSTEGGVQPPMGWLYRGGRAATHGVALPVVIAPPTGLALEAAVDPQVLVRRLAHHRFDGL